MLRRALNLARAGCEERTWKAFWRTTVDGLSATSVGEELAMTPEAVRNAKWRVLRRIKDELGALHDWASDASDLA